VSELSSPETSRTIRRLVEEWAPDVIRLEYPVSAALVRAPFQAPTVLIDYDPMLAQARSAASARERIDLWLDRRAWRRFDRRSRSAVDAVVVLTERDRDVVSGSRGARRVVCIPLGIEPLPTLDSRGRDHLFLFVGNMNHPSNRDAVDHLVDEIVPAIRAQDPEAVLTVVGQPHAAMPVEAPTAGVRFAGLVKDVYAYLDAAAVVVAPLRTGSGMRVKVLEALSGGKAVVAYPLALAGIGAAPGREVFVAEDAQDFADAVVQLLNDPDRRAEVGRAARAWALEHARWDQNLDAWDELYEELVDGDRSG
jgi:glycosyltransferase involved in cell wall biosynthesis